jgi:hypothetical protein
LEVACTRGEGMPSARVTSAQWVASRSPVCQQHQGHSLSEYGMCSGMGRHGSDDPDGSTVGPGVWVCDVLAGESCCKGLGFGVLVIDSGLPSADASDGSGVLPTCDGNDELGMVDGGGSMHTGSGGSRGNQGQHKGRDVRWVCAPDTVHACQDKDSGHADRAPGPALLLVNNEDGRSNHFEDPG